MNIKSILASLVLASTAVSSVAIASPTVVVRDHRAVEQPRILPAYDGPDGRWSRPRHREVTLGRSLHFAGDGRTFLDVGAQLGRFDRLQISGAGGRTLITQVYVEFDNGQEQSIRNINRTLTGNQSLTLDLDGNRRGVRRIVVYGNALNRGWRMPAGTFTVTAM